MRPIVVLDTGRGMKRFFRETLLRLRKAYHHSTELCAIGDPSCHLLYISTLQKTPHLCGRDRSFELALYYYARLRPAPSRRGLLVLCGNGLYRDAISVGHIRAIGGTTDRHVYTHEIIPELTERYAVRMLYLRRGVYDTDMLEWEALLGKRQVRVVNAR